MLKITYDNIDQEGSLGVTLSEYGTPRSLETGRSLDTAVILSLFTDRRAIDEDPIDESSDQRGFWGDTFPLEARDQWGSRLWTLARSKITGDVLRIAREMCQEALQWMVDDGVVSKFEVETSWALRGYLKILVTLYRPGNLAPQYSGPWEAIYGVG